MGAWIETPIAQSAQYRAAVAPHVGAWIETTNDYAIDMSKTVAPHVGAWIETQESQESLNKSLVAPHVGAWIETVNAYFNIFLVPSHPMWVRGLKLLSPKVPNIEQRRTPCGCVD